MAANSQFGIRSRAFHRIRKRFAVRHDRRARNDPLAKPANNPRVHSARVTKIVRIHNKLFHGETSSLRTRIISRHIKSTVAGDSANSAATNQVEHKTDFSAVVGPDYGLHRGTKWRPATRERAAFAFLLVSLAHTESFQQLC